MADELLRSVMAWGEQCAGKGGGSSVAGEGGGCSVADEGGGCLRREQCGRQGYRLTEEGAVSMTRVEVA